ncbi:unnamed protein product [Phytophthora fragariaefolia]|uniref:Unnamed protein product n=1 Tax=Phytophthora fragariaefolia TaxID=1490495 RepID=A0A9W6WVX9_9STRA|nr:unnamed protein product [Phytophthora fragariaefolia]
MRSSAGNSDADSDHSDSSSCEDVIPNIPVVEGLRGTIFIFLLNVGASYSSPCVYLHVASTRTPDMTAFRCVDLVTSYEDESKRFSVNTFRWCSRCFDDESNFDARHI